MYYSQQKQLLEQHVPSVPRAHSLGAAKAPARAPGILQGRDLKAEWLVGCPSERQGDRETETQRERGNGGEGRLGEGGINPIFTLEYKQIFSGEGKRDICIFTTLGLSPAESHI